MGLYDFVRNVIIDTTTSISAQESVFTPKHMKRALCTGGRGFIGSHLVKRLEELGWDVLIMDLPHDVTQKTDWEIFLPQVDYVFHLAGHLDNYYQGGDKADFASYLDVNAKSVALMFEVIVEKQLPIKKIVVASSQSVYGEGNYKNGSPLEEKEHDLPQPISAYGASKVAMESMLFSLGKLFKIPVVALRYSIVLGTGQKFKDVDSGALRSFVEMARSGEVVTHEDGLKLRDFVNIDDVIEAHIVVATNSKADYEVFNVGAGKSIEVMELAKYVADKFWVGARAGGKKRFCTARHSLMNIDKLKSLGWEPKHTWREAVDEYIRGVVSSA